METRTVKATFQEHLRTSSRRFPNDAKKVISLAKKRLGPGGVFTVTNFADKRYESFVEQAQRNYDSINTGNALILPYQDLLLIKSEELPTKYNGTTPHILAVGIPSDGHITPFRSPEDTIKQIKDLGGLVIAEHPFFKHGIGPYLQENPKVLEDIDAIEYPSGEAYLFQGVNSKGRDWAKEEMITHPHLTTVASMDGHSFYEFCRLSSEIVMPNDYTTLKSSDDISTALDQGFTRRGRMAILEREPSIFTKTIGVLGALDHIADLAYIIKVAPKLGQAGKFETERPEEWKPYL